MQTSNQKCLDPKFAQRQAIKCKNQSAVKCVI